MYLEELPEQILIEETIAKYGYDPHQLSNSSCKMVIAKCMSCGLVREKKFRYAKNIKLCMTCANGIRSRNHTEEKSKSMKDFYKNGGVHPMSGRRQTDEVRAILDRTGKPTSQETKDKLSVIMRRRKEEWSDERRSVFKTQLGKTGKLNHNYGRKPKWIKRFPYKDVVFRSSWEVLLAKHFDSLIIEWRYEPEAFDVVYTVDGVQKEGTYTPDFLAGEEYYEVKGLWLGVSQQKYLAFLEQYPHLKMNLVDRKRMMELKLL